MEDAADIRGSLRINFDEATTILADTVVCLFAATYPERTIALSFFRCLHESGAIEARVAEVLAWVEPARLGDYHFPPADRALIERLRAEG